VARRSRVRCRYGARLAEARTRAGAARPREPDARHGSDCGWPGGTARAVERSSGGGATTARASMRKRAIEGAGSGSVGFSPRREAQGPVHVFWGATVEKMNGGLELGAALAALAATRLGTRWRRLA